MEDHLSHKTNVCGPMRWFLITGFTVHVLLTEHYMYYRTEHYMYHRTEHYIYYRTEHYMYYRRAIKCGPFVIE